MTSTALANVMNLNRGVNSLTGTFRQIKKDARDEELFDLKKEAAVLSLDKAQTEATDVEEFDIHTDAFRAGAPTGIFADYKGDEGTVGVDPYDSEAVAKYIAENGDNAGDAFLGFIADSQKLDEGLAKTVSTKFKGYQNALDTAVTSMQEKMKFAETREDKAGAAEDLIYTVDAIMTENEEALGYSSSIDLDKSTGTITHTKIKLDENGDMIAGSETSESTKNPYELATKVMQGLGKEALSAQVEFVRGNISSNRQAILDYEQGFDDKGGQYRVMKKKNIWTGKRGETVVTDLDGNMLANDEIGNSSKGGMSGREYMQKHGIRSYTQDELDKASQSTVGTTGKTTAAKKSGTSEAAQHKRGLTVLKAINTDLDTKLAPDEVGQLFANVNQYPNATVDQIMEAHSKAGQAAATQSGINTEIAERSGWWPPNWFKSEKAAGDAMEVYNTSFDTIMGRYTTKDAGATGDKTNKPVDHSKHIKAEQATPEEAANYKRERVSGSHQADLEKFVKATGYGQERIKLAGRNLKKKLTDTTVGGDVVDVLSHVSKDIKKNAPGINATAFKAVDDAAGQVYNKLATGAGKAKDSATSLYKVGKKMYKNAKSGTGKYSNKPQSPLTSKVPKSITIQAGAGKPNNNPGNLKAAPGDWKKDKQGHVKFDTPRQGYDALVRQVGLDQGDGDTITTFIKGDGKKNGPYAEGNQEEYISYLVKALGATGPGQKLSDFPPHKVAQAVAWFESKTKFS